MKIGILTFHRSHNYGAFLQCYGLTHFLKELGHEVEVINFNNISPKGYSIAWSKHPIRNFYMFSRYRMFNRQQKRLDLSMPAVDSSSSEELCRLVCGKYDLIITGSDEVWRTAGGFRGVPNPYWLCGDTGSKKMAYAVSSRSDFALLTDEQREGIRNSLADFSFISMRDRFSQEMVQTMTEKKVHLCCDPTYLYDMRGDRARGREMLKKRFGVKGDRPIVGLMGKEKHLVRALREAFGKRIDIVSLYDYNAGTVNAMSLDPFEWIDAISAMDFMFTNYFHGMCFCIQNNTPFLAIDRREKIVERGKMYDLLEIEGLLDLFMTRNDSDYIAKAVQYLCEALERQDCVDFSQVVAHQKKTAESFIWALESL